MCHHCLMANNKQSAQTNEPTFEAQASQGALLSEGQHVATIESAIFTEAAANELYNDTTPQLAVKFKGEDGSITAWYNRRGFETFDELSDAQKRSGKYEPRGASNYAVDIKTGMRVENSEKTAQGIAYINALGINALGLAPGTKFKVSDLVGAEVGINVERNAQSKLRVTYSMPAEKVLA